MTEHVDEFRHGSGPFTLRIESRSYGSEQMRVLRDDRMFLIQVQSPDECLPQFTEKMKRPAEKCDISADRTATGKTGYGLVDNCLEDGSCQIFLGGAFVDQRLDIGLCEHSASCGDRIERLIVFGIFIQTGNIRLKKGRHLVDKRTCAAGTCSVHSLVDAVSVEIDDLGVFTAQLNGDIGLGGMLLQTGGDGNDFLDERDLHISGKSQTAGSGDDRADDGVPQLRGSFLDQVCKSSLYICKMSPVV